MTAIPESTPGAAPSREHPAQQRTVSRPRAEGTVDQVRPDEFQEGLRPEPSAPVRERRILRQESETKPIPTVPPGSGGRKPREPEVVPPRKVEASTRRRERPAARRVRSR